MRRLRDSTGTGGTGWPPQNRPIELRHQRLAVDAGRGEQGGVRQPFRRGAEYRRARAAPDRFPAPGAGRSGATRWHRAPLPPVRRRDRNRRWPAHSRYRIAIRVPVRHRQSGASDRRACPPPAPPRPCGPPSCGRTGSGHARRSAAEIDRDLAQRLHRVGMEPGTRTATRAAASAGTSCITPVSLLASITETIFGRAGQHLRVLRHVEPAFAHPPRISCSRQPCAHQLLRPARARRDARWR